jgi:hypothetical protein
MPYKDPEQQKARARARYLAHREEVIARSRAHALKDPDRIAKGRARYAASMENPELREAKRIKSREEYARNKASKLARHAAYRESPEGKIKHGARMIANYAIRIGQIQRAEVCECCGERNEKIQAHHDDYNAPLAVRWLCVLCHFKWHREHSQ